MRALFAGQQSAEDPEPGQPLPPPDPEAQQRALQVLVMAQRTADDHVATANQQAEKIRADAWAAAEQTAREAQAHAAEVRGEAEQALASARAAAEQTVREAQAHAAEVRREADQVLGEARAQATEIAERAQASAEELEREAQRRYQEAVGGLLAQREALQHQIQALQQFDRDYRGRLRAFMHDQLRALGNDEPPPPNAGTPPDPDATPQSGRVEQAGPPSRAGNSASMLGLLDDGEGGEGGHGGQRGEGGQGEPGHPPPGAPPA